MVEYDGLSAGTPTTRVLDAQIDPIAAITAASSLLTRGELVAFPTETVYGLGARVFDESQIQKIFIAKNRPQDNPLIAHVCSVDQVYTLASSVTETAERLMRHFFPGPLTLVLPKHPSVPPIVSAGLQSVAIRMPAHDIALALIEAVGQPLVAPSANRSGRPSPTTAAHVLADLNGRISAVLDGGPCRLGIESTVLSLLTDTPILLRPGIITKEEIQSFLGTEVHDFVQTESTVTHSPGMKYRHYAPSTPMRSVGTIDQALASSDTSMILALNNPTHDPRVHIIQSNSLYHLFRQADEQGKSEIVVVVNDQLREIQGVWNRIEKALYNDEGKGRDD